MKRRASANARLLASVLVVSFALGACFSASEGEALKKQVAVLKKKVATEIGRAEDKRKQLKSVMEKATALLTRNSADVGAQVERIQHNNNKLIGQIQELAKQINDLNGKLEKLKAKVEVNTETTQGNAQQQKAKTPDEMFSEGKRLLNAGDHVSARKLLRKFINAMPTDKKRCSQAQRLIGDSYYQQQKFAPAILEYGKIIEQYPKSKHVAHAYYRSGMGFYQLKFCTDAKKFLRPFVRRFRRNSNARAARKVLRLIRRYRRNKNFCSS
ncbi:MAG: outer membrane protein assembly factor BamD [Myxococcales bacterium]|nr:outer membrane protein assembly factor BamD [Myxococcales bacterium]